jgi:hypothetical protein
LGGLRSSIYLMFNEFVRQINGPYLDQMKDNILQVSITIGHNKLVHKIMLWFIHMSS